MAFSELAETLQGVTQEHASITSRKMSEHVNGHISNDELWPTKFLAEHNEPGNLAVGCAALVILNSAIEGYELFQRLHDHASFRLCADGGADRLSRLLKNEFPEAKWSEALNFALPDLIHGDLDSLSGEVREQYEDLGVEISKDPDQYSTDFGKAIKKVVERLPDVTDVLVLGSIGGRVDQGIGLLGELYREQIVRHSGIRFWLFSEASVSMILLPGTTVIHTPLKQGLIRRNIGILPLYGPAMITTEGLEWDVEDWPTELGGQMSTSNHIVADEIKVTTDKEVLFTVERVVT